MNKKLKKQFMSLLMTLIICTGMVSLKASAANFPAIEYMQVESSDGEVVNFDVIKKENPCNQNIRRDASYLNNCSISVAYADYGLHIQLETGTTKTASKLGVKDIKVQQKNGIFWTTIATSDGGSITNDDWYMGISKCTNAVDGEIYRIKCTHFAYIGGNYYHYDNTSDPFTYVKP